MSKAMKQQPATATIPRLADDPRYAELSAHLAARKGERAALVAQRAQLIAAPPRDDSADVLAGGLAIAVAAPEATKLAESISRLDGAIVSGEQALRKAESDATARAIESVMPRRSEIIEHLFDFLLTAQADLRELAELETELHGLGYGRAVLPQLHGHYSGGDRIRQMLHILRAIDLDEVRRVNQPDYRLPICRNSAGTEAHLVGA